MTRQQHQIVEAFRSRSYFGGMGALGVESAQITSAIGSGLLSAAGVVAAVPGGQLPGAIIAATGALTSLIGSFFKPDLTKIQATQIVNDIEAKVLKPMRASWQALRPEEKTASMQAYYLNIFDSAWSAIEQGCSNPSLGTAGQACIGDRAQGACHYTLTGQVPGQPPDNCGNWFTWYRDVIANDPDVHADTVSPSSSGGSFLSSATGPGMIPTPLLIAAALLGAFVFLGGD